MEREEMRNILDELQSKQLKIVKSIGKLADQKKLSVYLVGGVVRDLLLKRDVCDLDFVVVGKAIPFARAWAKEQKGKATVHDLFGTATVELKDQTRIDFSTARSEKYLEPGSLPEVEFASLKEDLLRRDFTVNALAVSLNRQTWGELIDEGEGLKDLDKKVIRVFHDKSFEDDPTRILRAVRFEQRFGFKIEKKTLELMKDAIKKDFVRRVTPQRYFNEFRKNLSEPFPSKSLSRLNKLSALGFLCLDNPLDLSDVRFMEELRSSKKIQQGIEGVHKTWLIFLLGILGRQDSPVWAKVTRLFALSRQEKDVVLFLQYVGDKLEALSDQKLSRSQVYHHLNPLDLHVIVYLGLRCRKFIVQKRIWRYLRHDRYVETLLNGHDLKKLGIGSGQRVGMILRAVLDAKIKGKIKTRAQETKLVKEYLSS